ncbi:MAG: hypothetical protein C0631_19005 [Sedimenticola sp.]|nr:MAG: hypothetical protein C0631_19005 [Sedimenticola sp.]
MGQKLEIGKFLSLKQQELNAEEDDLIDKLEVSTQSIHRWLQYCEYHYICLVGASEEGDLRLDRISSTGYRRAGETVTVRYVYEANIAAFLNSLHALLDSFPYLLYLFIPRGKSNFRELKWNKEFIDRYKDESFYDELMNFLLDRTFNKVKGYVNTIKHKHLIRISNKWDHLEFEEYQYRQPYRDGQGGVMYQDEVVAGENVLTFIEACHDELIPKLFSLCNSILQSKASELQGRQG